jgi:hypothetical protein
MPPARLSRYSLSLALKDAQGRQFLTDPEPFRYQDLPDNRHHTVVAGDALWTLSCRAFPNIKDGQHLWPIVAWFQPQPIHDPTLELTPGRELVFPSERTVLETIFNASRSQR